MIHHDSYLHQLYQLYQLYHATYHISIYHRSDDLQIQIQTQAMSASASPHAIEGLWGWTQWHPPSGFTKGLWSQRRWFVTFDNQTLDIFGRNFSWSSSRQLRLWDLVRHAPCDHVSCTGCFNYGRNQQWLIVMHYFKAAYGWEKPVKADPFTSGHAGVFGVGKRWAQPLESGQREHRHVYSGKSGWSLRNADWNLLEKLWMETFESFRTFVCLRANGRAHSSDKPGDLKLPPRIGYNSDLTSNLPIISKADSSFSYKTVPQITRVPSTTGLTSCLAQCGCVAPKTYGSWHCAVSIGAEMFQRRLHGHINAEWVGQFQKDLEE